MTEQGSGVPYGLASCAGGLALVGLMGRLTVGLAGGLGEPRRLALGVLLLETLFLLGAAASVGLLQLRRRASLEALACVLAVASIAVVVGIIAGASANALLAAQPVAAATVVLGWGLGRAARDALADPTAATAVAFVMVLVFATSLLPISHLSPLLASSPRASELLLAVSPFVGVASSAGIDLVRQESLYNSLTLADYRFRYPHPLVSVALLTALGVVFGLARKSWFHRSTKRLGVDARSSRIAFSVPVVLLWLSVPTALRAEQPHAAPPHLSVLLEETIDTSITEVFAAGSEVLALDERRRARVERWVRRGGRLLLSGDAVEPALRLWSPYDCEGDRCTVGLGEVIGVFDAWPSPRGASTSHGAFFAPAAARLAKSALPDGRSLRVATASRLLTYALLLGLVFCLGRAFAVRWTWLGAGSLVLVFGLWPWWNGPILRSDQVGQVDVVVDVDAGPALFWSVASLRAVGRHEAVVRTGSGSWNLHEMGATAARATRGGEDGNITFSFDVSRGSEITGLVWLADEQLDGRVTIDVDRSNGRVTGLARNGSAKTWTDVWLLVPGLEPLALEDLGPGGALLLDHEGTESLRGTRWRDLTRNISLERARLIEAALEPVIEPLLLGGSPVLLAWTEGPLRPARLAPDRPVERGATLLIRGGGKTT